MIPENIKHKIELRYGKTKCQNIDDLKKLLDKICINAYIAKVSDGSRQEYRHPDLDEFSKQAFNNNQNYFYCEPVNPDNPNGAQKLTEPIYKYRFIRSLTQEEFESIFGSEIHKNNTIELDTDYER